MLRSTVPDDEANASTLAVAPPRALHSDPHDFAGLYIRHRSSFTAHARRYLRDQRDADEVVQEAFLRLFLALPELDTELQALAYCRRTITNLCIDRYRAQARRPYLVDLESAHVEDLADDDPGDPVVRAEDAALVRDALSLLSPLQRAALVKREVEDKSLPAIAGELDIPEDNVKHLLFRARRALRKLLAGTSLAPGADAERHGLGVSAKAGSRGLATLLVLAVLGLGSGPNLEAVPVVGVDLPDVIGVTEVADALRGAATGLGEKIAPSGGAGTSTVGAGLLESALLVLSDPFTERSAEAGAQPGKRLVAAEVPASTSVLSGALAPRPGQVPGVSPQAPTPGSPAGPSASTTAADRAGTPPGVVADVPKASDRPSPSAAAPAPGGRDAAPNGPRPGTGNAAPKPGRGAGDAAPNLGAGTGGSRPGAVAPQPPATAGEPGSAAGPAPGNAAAVAEKAAAKAADKAAKAAAKAAEAAAKGRPDKPPPKPKHVPPPPAPAVVEPAPVVPTVVEPAEPVAVEPVETVPLTP